MRNMAFPKIEGDQDGLDPMSGKPLGSNTYVETTFLNGDHPKDNATPPTKDPKSNLAAPPTETTVPQPMPGYNYDRMDPEAAVPVDPSHPLSSFPKPVDSPPPWEPVE